MERAPIEEMANKIANGKPLDDSERAMASKIIMLVGQRLYEKTGAMFICGYAGEVDASGCPETLFVCPAFGADMMECYNKQKRQ